ncbi:MAG TPA: glycosyltransferase family 39 protein [Candidatus Moranbacteria bacterium]|nr:glycosyltransferase family 39 protein [Candidatus Moranbacteria bacterium]HRZ33895.1 glycosyltransferase family 39 protein [Candidatus Moranbacteria bacterium]
MLKKIITPLVISLVIAINLFLGLSRLDKYSAVDEPYWTYGRTSKFWTAIENHNWKSTNVNDKPGITVAILSGFGLLKYDPMQYESLRENVKTEQQLHDIRAINFYFRLPIFLFCTLILLAFYFLLKKLFGDIIALLSFIFISFSPIIFGISLIINPDSLLWIFLPLSILSYFVFKKEENKKYLVLSGFFMGLSLLTKYVANILYIFFFALPFLEYIFIEKKPVLSEYLKKSFVNYLTLVAFSMLTFFILFPASWTNLEILLEGTFLSKAFETTWPVFASIFTLVALDIILLKSKVMGLILGFISKHKTIIVQIFSSFFILFTLLVLINTYSGMKFIDFVSFLSSPKGIGADNILESYAGAILSDTYSLIFGMCPFAFLAFIFALFLSVRGKTSIDLELQIIFYFLIFIFLYYLASSVNEVTATVRYQIVTYPLAMIISAIGISKFISCKKVEKYIPNTLAIVFVLAVSFLALFSARPFYLAYASPLLPEKYLLNYKDMGDGSYEAAEYLNSLPDAQNLIIWSDKGSVCAEFLGKCAIGYNKKKLKNFKFDYVVVSSGRESKSSKSFGSIDDVIDIEKAYKTENYLQKIILGRNNSNFVKIVETDSLKK